jgi:hypothetical protein
VVLLVRAEDDALTASARGRAGSGYAECDNSETGALAPQNVVQVFGDLVNKLARVDDVRRLIT